MDMIYIYMSSSFRIISVDTDDSAGFEGTGSGNVTGCNWGYLVQGEGIGCIHIL